MINAGISAATSKTEVQLIKDKLIDFSPDLIVVFDGINDASWVANPFCQWSGQWICDSANPIHPLWDPQFSISWKDRWTEICNIGKKNGFDVLIALQPFYKSGFQVLTENEYEYYHKISSDRSLSSIRTDAYPSYINQLPELNKKCTKAVDMSRIFDKIPENLFADDSSHVGSLGNKIIAENLYQIILPIIEKTQYFESSVSNIISKNDISNLLNLHNLNLNNVNFENLDISGIDFSGKDLENVVFL